MQHRVAEHLKPSVKKQPGKCQRYGNQAEYWYCKQVNCWRDESHAIKNQDG